MRLAHNIQYLKMWLLSILFSIFLLSNSFQSSAYTGTCSLWNVTAWSTSTCTTWYTGSNALFYSVETNTNIADVNYNIALNSSNNIVFRNVNGFLWATIAWVQIHYTDYIWQVWATGATGSVGGTGATGPGAYELAVSLGFTGTIFEWFASLQWPVWATGTTQIVFATGSQIFSGATFSLSQENAVLDSSGSYLPLLSKIDWTTYIDMDRAIQWLLMIIVALMIAYWFWSYISKKITWKKSYYP